MPRLSNICVAAITMMAAAGAAAAQSGAMTALERLGSALRTSDAWRADYEQEYVAAGMTRGEVVHGSVTVAWPDRARFETGEPATQLMALDGRLVRLVDLEIGSCDQHLLDDEEWSRIPLAAVLDPSAAITHFTVVAHGDPGFALIPHRPGGVQRVEVLLGERGLPIEVVIVDPQGATNRLRFSAWRTTAPPAGANWLPDPPAGVECVTDEP